MMSFKNICKVVFCCVLLVSTPTIHTHAQVGTVVKSVSKIFRKKVGKEVVGETAEKVAKEATQGAVKKAGKEIAEETAEQALKRISKEVAETTIKKNAADALFASSKTITKKTISEVAPAAIKKTMVAQLGKEISEKALKTTSKEFVQQIGKETTEEASQQFIKRLGTESTQESFELATKKSMKETSITTSKTWLEKRKDLYHKLRLQILGKVHKSKIYKNLLHINKKGPIKLTSKEIDELLANPTQKNFNNFIEKKLGRKDIDLMEFYIRLKKSNPEQLKKLLNNKAIKAHTKKYIRDGGGYHEWLICENLEDFLLNPKWGKDGDYLALLLTKFSQETGTVGFKIGGGHHIGKGPAKNSVIFHNKLQEVIDSSNSIEELFVNIRRFAKKNLKEEDYKEFLKVFDEVLK